MRSGWNALQRVELLAGADQLDRLAGDRAHAERGAAARIAVDPGQHDAGDADLLVEGAREVDRVLAGQRVGHQQRLVRPHPVAHRRELAHQLLVDVQPAGGIQDHHVEPLARCGLERARGDRERRLARHDRQALDARLARQHRELLLRRRALHVERGEQRLLPLAGPEAQRELGAGRGLARALQPDHQHHPRRRAGEREIARRRRPAARPGGR